MSTYIPHDVMGILVGQLFRCGSSSRKVWKFRSPESSGLAGLINACTCTLHIAGTSGKGTGTGTGTVDLPKLVTIQVVFQTSTKRFRCCHCFNKVGTTLDLYQAVDIITLQYYHFAHGCRTFSVLMCVDVGCVIVIRHASEATVICRLAYACTYEGQVQASHVRTSTYVRVGQKSTGTSERWFRNNDVTTVA
jgi:hypothetical protein